MAHWITITGWTTPIVRLTLSCNLSYKAMKFHDSFIYCCDFKGLSNHSYTVLSFKKAFFFLNRFHKRQNIEHFLCVVFKYNLHFLLTLGVFLQYTPTHSACSRSSVSPSHTHLSFSCSSLKMEQRKHSPRFRHDLC